MPRKGLAWDRPVNQIRFGIALRRLRLKAGLTQVSLATTVGCHKCHISNIECGKYDPTWSFVMALCDALVVTPNAFLPVAGESLPKNVMESPRRRVAPDSGH